MVAVIAYLHCDAEPGDASAMALLATLRKRLLCVRELASRVARALQVGLCADATSGRNARPHQVDARTRQGCIRVPQDAACKMLREATAKSV